LFPPPPDDLWAPRSTLEPATILKAIFLVDPDHAIVPVAWTLSYEMLFYCFFALYLLGGGRVFSLLALAWFGLIAAQWSGAIGLPHPNLLRPIITEFFLGCLAAMIVRRWSPVRISPWWLVVPILLSVVLARA